MDRAKKIIQTSYIGIVVNVILVIFKMILGLLTNSIAILLDAVNNMSDALSSIITIVGTKLAGRKPDKKHPFGYGRIEYLTSALIAVLVLFAGITSLKESIVKIIHPQAAEYSAVSLVIIAIAVVVKYFCGRYVKSVGEKINSGALIASGSEAFFDAILSLGTLVIALISMFWQLKLEGIFGAVIAIIIIKAGIEILLETLNSIIGTREDGDFTKSLKKQISSYDGVHGAYDLVLHNYGPTRLIGTVHIEVDDDMEAKQIHHLSRRIISDIYKEHGIILTVGIYATNNTDELTIQMRSQIVELIANYPDILQMHAFYVDEERKLVNFDLVISFRAQAEVVRDEIVEKLKAQYEGYTFSVNIDYDFSD